MSEVTIETGSFEAMVSIVSSGRRSVIHNVFNSTRGPKRGGFAARVNDNMAATRSERVNDGIAFEVRMHQHGTTQDRTANV